MTMSLSEHVRLIKGSVLIGVLVLATVIGTDVGAFFFGSRHATNNLVIQRVTPNEVATAMQHDNFYSKYGNDTLIIRGIIAKVSDAAGVVTIDFTRAGGYGTQCQLQPSTTRVYPGASITVIAESGSASRLSMGVLFHDCLSTTA